MNKEKVIAKADELQDGQMKEVKVEDRSILLVRVKGEYRAYLPECPHHGAPLSEGVLCDGRLRCPWHQTVFDAATGNLLDPPSLDRLAHYEVRVEGDDVIVSIPEHPAESRPPAMVGLDTNADDRTFAIIGAGAAGMAAAETLRHEGYRGRIVMLTREKAFAYDRTQLSKRYLAKPDASAPFIRDAAFYTNHGIELLPEHEVTEVDVSTKTITCADDTAMNYDRLLVVSGGAPRKLDVEGADLGNVFTLRSLADSNCLREAAAAAERAVVVGASFIGMEVAASLESRDVPVTVVAPEATPFERTLGQRIGRMYREVHEDKGGRFRLGTSVERFEGEDGKVARVVCKDGETLEADLVVVGIGVRPVTGFLKGVQINDDGSLNVDERFGVRDSVFAAGDVARFPDWRAGRPIRIEHWRLAQQHGMAAARAMLDKDPEFRDVPFFWTNQHWVIVQYVGYAREWDEIVVDGDISKQQFVAYYVKGGWLFGEKVGMGRLQLFARHEASDYDRNDDLRDNQVNAVGANYYLDGQQLKLTFEFADVTYDEEDPLSNTYSDHKQATLGFQMLF